MSKSRKKNSSTNQEQMQDPATNEVENTGNYLRTLRLGKGLSIQDVTEATRISATNLNAIEDENFSALPANTFTRGLLSIYADFLGANAEAIVTKFMADRGGSPSQKRRSKQKQSGKILSPKRLAEPTQISSVTMAGILFMIIAVSFTGYCVYTSWNPFSFLLKDNRAIQSVMQSVFPEKEAAQDAPTQKEVTVPAEVPPLQTTTPPQPALENAEIPVILPAETIMESEEPTVEQGAVIIVGYEELIIEPGAEIAVEPEEPVSEQETEALEPNYTVTIRFLEDTSIELTGDDGETIVEEFKSGDVKMWSTDSSLAVTFSQPDSAEILVNDSAVTFPEPQHGMYTLQIPHDIAELQPDE